MNQSCLQLFGVIAGAFWPKVIGIADDVVSQLAGCVFSHREFADALNHNNNTREELRVVVGGTDGNEVFVEWEGHGVIPMFFPAHSMYLAVVRAILLGFFFGFGLATGLGSGLGASTGGSYFGQGAPGASTVFMVPSPLSFRSSRSHRTASRTSEVESRWAHCSEGRWARHFLNRLDLLACVDLWLLGHVVKRDGSEE